MFGDGRSFPLKLHSFSQCFAIELRPSSSAVSGHFTCNIYADRILRWHGLLASKLINELEIKKKIYIVLTTYRKNII